MDISILRIFKAVAEEGSVSKAALKLNYVQSNVTARIRQLEDELDVKLFYRKKRGMELTPSGKSLTAYADRIISLIQEAEKAVRETEIVKGPLCIGTLDSTAAARLPTVLIRFRREYPDVEVTIITGSSVQLIQMVLDYKLDGAFIGTPVENQEIEQEPMFNEELVIVSALTVDSFESIVNPTILVFPKGCSYRSVLENWLTTTGRVPYKIMEFGTLEGILGCVMAGLGIAMFPHSVIENLNYLDRLAIHKVPEKLGFIPTMFIRKKDTVITKSMEAFLKIVREQI